MKRLIGVFATGLLALGGTGAQAADLPVKVRPAPAPMAVAHNWTGFYIGGHAGAAFGRADTSGYNDLLFPPFITLPPGAPILVILGSVGSLPSSSARNTSWIAGAQIGYNWQVNSFVFGFEADASGTGVRMTGTATNTRFPGTGVDQTARLATTTDIDWMASFRARLGFAADRALFYVTGGGAVADIDVSNVFTLVNGPAITIPAGTFTSATGSSRTRLGWTVGGGIEWAFTDNWSVAGEYRHSNFGRVGGTFVVPDGLGTTFATGTNSTRVRVDQATLRLNYRFGAGPVVARY